MSASRLLISGIAGLVASVVLAAPAQAGDPLQVSVAKPGGEFDSVISAHVPTGVTKKYRLRVENPTGAQFTANLEGSGTPVAKVKWFDGQQNITQEVKDDAGYDFEIGPGATEKFKITIKAKTKQAGCVGSSATGPEGGDSATIFVNPKPSTVCLVRKSAAERRFMADYEVTVAKSKDGPYDEDLKAQAPNESADFFFRVKSRSDAIQQLRLGGTGADPDYKVRWYKGSQNITAEVREDGKLFQLNPHKRKTFRLEIETIHREPQCLYGSAQDTDSMIIEYANVFLRKGDVGPVC